MIKRIHKFCIDKFWWIIAAWAALNFIVGGWAYVLSAAILTVIGFIFLLLVLNPAHDDWFDGPRGPL